MKKIKWVVLIIVIIFGVFYYLQFGRKVEIRDTKITSYQDGYAEEVNITANKLYIMDKDKFAKDVIDTFIDNSFDNIKFSFDLGYPDTLHISVYMNKWNKNVAFEICCLFNISDVEKKLDYYEFEIRK